VDITDDAVVDEAEDRIFKEREKEDEEVIERGQQKNTLLSIG